MANMTISSSDAPSVSGRISRLRKVTFTHTAAGTAAGSAETSFDITGRLLRITTDDGGDASWDVTLVASAVTLWARTAFGASEESFPLGWMWDAGRPAADTEVVSWGIPLVEEKLTLTTANMGGTGTGPIITIIWEESI